MLGQYGAVGAIVAGASALQLGSTLVAVLVPLQLNQAGVSAVLIGLVASAYGLGFLVGCFRAHVLIRSVGHIRAFAALAALCSIVALALTIAPDPWLWLVLRLILGFCVAGLYIAVEGWLNAATARSQRGRVIGFYLVATKVAIVAGQAALAWGTTSGAGFFMVASTAFSLSLVPVAVTSTHEPPPPRLVLMGLRELYRLAPTAVVGCLGAGLLNSAFQNMTPVYGADRGFSVAVIVLLLSLPQIGSLFLQWPLGWLSDRIDRRLVIIGCTTFIAAVSLVILLIAPRQQLGLGILFLLWGASAYSVYGVCVAHAGDFAEPDQMVGVSGSALFAWAVGSMLGPTLAAPVMTAIGPGGLFAYTTVVALTLSLFAVWRMTRRSAMPPEERTDFVNLPATSPALARIDPRAEGAGRQEWPAAAGSSAVSAAVDAGPSSS
jgi:MFS family permease